MRRADVVSTTVVANARENSTLGEDTMHATLPVKSMSSPGCCHPDATPCGRVEGEGTAVAPAAADATDWARAYRVLFTTKKASRAVVFACSISSSNRHRRASRR